MYDQQLADAYRDLDAREREITELKQILRDARTVIEHQDLRLGHGPEAPTRTRTLEAIDKAL